jgi:hypothetical protein
MATPLPRVTKPPMASGGAGRQQRASVVSSDSTPTTSTPPLSPPGRARGLRSAMISSAVGAGLGGRSRFSICAQRELVLAHHLEQRLGLLEAQLLGQASSFSAVRLRAAAAFPPARGRARWSPPAACALNQARTLARARGLFR